MPRRRPEPDDDDNGLMLAVVTGYAALLAAYIVFY